MTEKGLETRRPKNITKRKDDLLKELRKNRKEANMFKHLREHIYKRIKAEHQNTERWENRMEVLEEARGSIREMDQDLSMSINVLRLQKKENKMRTELNMMESENDKESYAELSESKSEFDSGVPSMTKLNMVASKKKEVDEAIQPLRERKEEMKKKKKRLNKKEEEIDKKIEKIEKIKEQQQGG